MHAITPIIYDPIRWEYKRIEADTPPSEATLNQLGDEGWEVVSILPSEKLYFTYCKRSLR